MSNERCFGEVASTYQTYRPAYPRALFDALTAAASRPRRRAVDLGAGTGLVAIGLCELFESVTAVEPDERMLALLPRTCDRLMRVCARAEEVDTAAGSIDLVTAGNSLHWMDAPVVVEHAANWLRGGGVFAAFCYRPPHALNEVDAVLSEEMRERWSPFVHPRLHDEGYSRRSVHSCARWSSIEVQRIANVVELAPADLAGFCGSTSYGAAYAATLPHPETYLEDLRHRLESASAGRAIPIDFGLELVLARRDE